MKINRFQKKKNGTYLLFLENGEQIELYEEVLLKYELLLSKKLEDQKRENILLENEKWATYYQALHMIQIKARTKKEVEEELLKKGYQKENITFSLLKLSSQNYLDDKRYANSYVNNQIRTTSWGPLKIQNALLKKGVFKEDMEEALSLFTKEIEEEKIRKIVKRMIHGNRSKSVIALKQKIKQHLLQEGYDSILVQDEISKASYQSDTSYKEREYEKLKKKLERKYQGEELERAIQMKLFQKGFRKDE